MATASVGITPECSICCEHLKTPKVLTCGHTYCLDCIDRYISDKKMAFLSLICEEDNNSPEGSAKMFTTNFILQTSPHTKGVTGTKTSPTTQDNGTPTSPTSQNTGTPTSPTSQVTDTPTSTTTQDVILNEYCPKHSNQEIEYYCATCDSGFCNLPSCYIATDHKDHATFDYKIEHQNYKESIITKLKELKQFRKILIEKSEKLKSFHEDAITKIIGKIVELNESIDMCENMEQDIQDHFNKNELQLTETRQKVMTQIQHIKTDLDAACPTTEEPSLTLIYSRTKLQDLHTLCKNLEIVVEPPVTYVDYRKGNILKTTKPLFVFGSIRCKRPKCDTCKHMPITDVFKSNTTGKKFSMTDELSCDDHNLIYLISCRKCGKQYIGKTEETLRKRFQNHWFLLKRGTGVKLYSHFNSDDHSIEDVLIMPIEKIPPKVNILDREMYWIQELQTDLNVKHSSN